MTDDRGAGALAAALEAVPWDDYSRTTEVTTPEDAPNRVYESEVDMAMLAAAILGEHGRFLPDGTYPCATHQAEVERLQRDLVNAHMAIAQEQAEVERLRAALAECSLIAGATTFGPSDGPEISLREVVRIARAALSPELKP